MKQTEEMENRLRKAITEGAFEQAQGALKQYRAQLMQRLQQIPPKDPRALEILEQTLNFLEWMRRMVTANKGHTSCRLQNLRSSRAYQASVVPPASGLISEG